VGITGQTSARAAAGGSGIDELSARAYTIPTDAPEADGTLSWEQTTIVVARARSAEQVGLCYSYAAAPAAALIEDVLAAAVTGCDAMAPQATWERMRAAVRNIGYPGVAACAISAVDSALWDLKARLLDVSLATLLGAAREQVPVYGSGGFTSYTDAQLARQLAGWVREGISAVKMKVGSEPERDTERVRRAREAIGSEGELYVDANGAYERKQALRLAERFSEESAVSWFEEPVSSDDLEGLRMLRDRAPAPMRIAAGEYGYEPAYFQRMLAAGAVDVLQADVTRCGGITQMLNAGALCAAAEIPMSAHTAPSLHAHVCAAIAAVENVEYFHDHARIEAMLFYGLPELVEGALRPDPERPGHGLALREGDAERYQV
jgi:L-alanine-DL-glutamate epimerase-like enolase superfamily enzyme